VHGNRHAHHHHAHHRDSKGGASGGGQGSALLPTLNTGKAAAARASEIDPMGHAARLSTLRRLSGESGGALQLGFGSGVPEVRSHRGEKPSRLHAIENAQPPLATARAPQVQHTPRVVETSPIRHARRSTEGSSQGAALPPKEPRTPAQVLLQSRSVLTEFEEGEILGYKQVWYAGEGCTSKPSKQQQRGSNNYGVDDDKGDFKVYTKDHIQYRYEILGVLGKGSFGVVCKVLDHKSNTFKAVKIIRNRPRFREQANIEVKILKQLNATGECQPNVVQMHDHFVWREHLCISFELLGLNLYEFIKENKFRGMNLSVVRRYAIQMLHVLKLCDEQRVIHCDLKPENVLLHQQSKNHIKVVDFGSACLENERVYTYIQSRFYRSPEVILGHKYSMRIDMWSFGCILAELVTGQPLFAGENESEQMACMMEVLGQPPSSMVESSSRKKVFYKDGLPRIVANSRGRRRRPGTKPLSSAVRTTHLGFLDFLEGCLRWDPSERMSPTEALKHDWITGKDRESPPGAGESSVLRSSYALRSSRHRSSDVGLDSGFSMAASILRTSKRPPEEDHLHSAAAGGMLYRNKTRKSILLSERAAPLQGGGLRGSHFGA